MVDLSKILFYGVATCTVLGATFVQGIRAGSEKTAAFFLVSDLKASIADSLHTTIAEAPTLTGTRPGHFLQAARYEGDGVTVNDPSADQTDLILLSGFFHETNELRLIRRNGDIVARWPVSHSTLFPDPDFFAPNTAPATDWNIDLHGALAMPDGSVVFNFEYGGTVKLDRCNTVEWTVRRMTHHSVERAESGGFWVPARNWITAPESPFPPFETPFYDDTVLHVSEDGDVLSEFSVARLLYDNGLETTLTATGATFERGMPWDHEVVHLNKVAELPGSLAAEFPGFEAGDLVVSVRGLNLLMVADRAGSKIKWWQIGPWRRQHDPEFVRAGRILLFNNNTYGMTFSTPFGTADRKTPPSAPRLSQIVAVDPGSGRAEVVYGGKPGQEILSVTRGKVATTASGGLVITEADGGRVREVNDRGAVVWEYVNRHSEDEIAELGEARVYPAGYFDIPAGASWCDHR